MKSPATLSSLQAVPSYFTGSEFGIALIREELRTNDRDELVNYFNDLYAMFLHHYAALGHEDDFSVAEQNKMSAMLAELCKVKHLMGQMAPEKS